MTTHFSSLPDLPCHPSRCCLPTRTVGSAYESPSTSRMQIATLKKKNKTKTTHHFSNVRQNVQIKASPSSYKSHPPHASPISDRRTWPTRLRRCRNHKWLVKKGACVALAAGAQSLLSAESDPSSVTDRAAKFIQLLPINHSHPSGEGHQSLTKDINLCLH